MERPEVLRKGCAVATTATGCLLSTPRRHDGRLFLQGICGASVVGLLLAIVFEARWGDHGG